MIIDTTWREVPEIYMISGGKHRSINEIIPPSFMDEHERKRQRRQKRAAELARQDVESCNRSLVAITVIASSFVGICLGCSMIGAMCPVIGAAGIAGLAWDALFCAANMR